MQTPKADLTVEFLPSKEKLQVPLRELERATVEFLELYGAEPLVDAAFCAVTGQGDGESRLVRLLSAAGHEDDAQGFFEEVLAQLALANGQDAAHIAVDGVRIPYALLLAILEVLIPGDAIIDVKTLSRLEKLTNRKVPEEERDALREVLAVYPARFSAHTIRQMRLSPAVAYQYQPFADELDREGLVHTWVGQFHRGVIEQMYRNRVIFILNMTCPAFCRFCFRKHKECRTQRAPTQKHVDLGVAYIKSCPEIKEVVLTGGDPFMNRPTLTQAIDGLAKVPHVETLRVATRALSYHPAMFTGRDGFWLDYLKRKQLELAQRDRKIEIATHFIHPDEVTIRSLEVIAELVGNGIGVYVQTPYVGGCNDSGETLAELYRRLRGAGAEMHYIFMPCSPIQGNRRYASTLSSGLQAARVLRATLSDRAMPHLCTATSIGKIDWGTSGWAVEVDQDDERFVWLRTPYSLDYFETFAPILDLSRIARPNREGTLDARLMAEAGDEAILLGPREARSWARPLAEAPTLPEHTREQRLSELRQSFQSDPAPTPSIVDTGLASLARPHMTRVELNCDATDDEIARSVGYIAADIRVTDVVLYSRRDVAHTLYRAGAIIERLQPLPHVSAVRLRSLAAAFEPEAFSDGMIRRMTSLNRLASLNPTRLEVETLLLHPTDLKPDHQRLVKALRRRGVTIHASIPLLASINDTCRTITDITAACRRLGIEIHHLCLAGLPAQTRWNAKQPIPLSRVLDIASFLRTNGSGRELPRYIVSTDLGEVDFGLTAEVVNGYRRGLVRLRLTAYDLDYYRSLDPDFRLPAGFEVDDEGHPIVTVPGLTA